MKFEQERGRERIITDDEFAALLGACTNDAQRDLLHLQGDGRAGDRRVPAEAGIDPLSETEQRLCQ